MTTTTIALETPQFDARFPNTNQVRARASACESAAAERRSAAHPPRARRTVPIAAAHGGTGGGGQGLRAAADEELLAELGRLPQVHRRPGGGLPGLPKVQEGLPLALPERMGTEPDEPAPAGRGHAARQGRAGQG